jgi:hypothetical protein
MCVHTLIPQERERSQFDRAACGDFRFDSLGRPREDALRTGQPGAGLISSTMLNPALRITGMLGHQRPSVWYTSQEAKRTKRKRKK